jgi:hypothetical protein
LQILKILKNAVFWDMTSRGSGKNRRFERTYRVEHQGELLVIADVPSSSILVTLMMVEIRFSETSVDTRATRKHIPEDGILQAVS